jgi:hypothetical protein
MENVNTGTGSMGSRGLNSAKTAIYDSPKFKAFLSSCYTLLTIQTAGWISKLIRPPSKPQNICSLTLIELIILITLPK